MTVCREHLFASRPSLVLCADRSVAPPRNGRAIPRRRALRSAQSPSRSSATGVRNAGWTTRSLARAVERARYSKRSWRAASTASVTSRHTVWSPLRAWVRSTRRRSSRKARAPTSLWMREQPASRNSRSWLRPRGWLLCSPCKRLTRSVRSMIDSWSMLAAVAACNTDADFRDAGWQLRKIRARLCRDRIWVSRDRRRVVANRKTGFAAHRGAFVESRFQFRETGDEVSRSSKVDCGDDGRGLAKPDSGVARPAGGVEKYCIRADDGTPGRHRAGSGNP